MKDNAPISGIITFIREMNRCWTKGWHEDQFRQCIHKDAVAIVPTVPGRLEGHEAYIAGWRGFAEAVIVHEWKESGHLAQLHAEGNCAVVTYFFSITFTRGAERQTMKGRDMFFLIRQSGRWLVVADQFSPEPRAG
jgi:ketosteroid isomerase-like protein